LLSNEIISIDFVKSKKNIVDPQTKDLMKEFVYNSSKGTSLKPIKDKIEYVKIVTILSWLKIIRSRFKWRTKSYNILGSIRKLLFPIYFYDEISGSTSMIKGELSS